MPDGPGGFRQGFTCPALLRYHWKENCILTYGAITLYGGSFQSASINTFLSLFLPTAGFLLPENKRLILWPCNPVLSVRIVRFRLFRVRSPLLAESLLFYFPLGTEMVHFPRLASRHYVFIAGYMVFTPCGFPHSEIPGSKDVCSSPRHIAACHVLHRLLAPRHPHACP